MNKLYSKWSTYSKNLSKCIDYQSSAPPSALCRMELFIECPVKKNMKGNKKHS
jgi:hypothetical protein